MSLSNVLVVLIVCAAALFFGHRVYTAFQKGGDCGCGCGKNCKTKTMACSKK
ncbi:MAG: hypothetical protein IJS54_06895 [Desulfovibrio sp.]|nr:hypothetical protein [Desulfovibrio sp.]